MAIAKKPKANPDNSAPNADAFIRGADHPEADQAPPAGGRRRRKEPVMLRFDDAVLDEIDTRAARLGLSRAAWVRMVVAERIAAEQGR